MQKTHNNSFATNIKTVIRNRQLRSQYTFRYNELGEGRWIKDITSMTDEEFNKLYPIKVKKLLTKGQNCDGKKRWIDG